MFVLVCVYPMKINADNLSGYRHSVIINDDYGGEIKEYNSRFREYDLTNTLVIINGDCISACARFQKLKHVCATDTGFFFFHGISDNNERLLIPEGIKDSKATDNPKGWYLENKYKTFAFSVVKKRPYAEKKVEDKVWIVYLPLDDQTGYQKFLKVKADKIVPACYL